GVVGLVNGANPGHMALTPDGQLLTIVTTGLRTSGVGNYIAVIRTDTLLPFGTGQLRVSNADFATANNIVFGLNGIGYVASYGTNTVYVFDPFQFAWYTIPVGQGPGAITLSPDGRLLAVNNALSQNLSLVDLNARRVVATITPTRGALNPFSKVEFS